MKFILVLSLVAFLVQKRSFFTIHGSFCDGCDLGGGDISNFPSAGLEDCWIGCLNNPSCTFFAIAKSNNNCWLKNKVVTDFSLFYDYSQAMCGIVDRSKSCSAIEDFTPNPNN
ncbi:unnamed protein product [Brachionus calyciflorus]|uniref:Apple domain-containing protein n=1 Tax=Brachionus calyciflorus TaxID=104777 RepID=A0A814H8B4_9BILA|nr:unnamed protein product [Brachionus calyciflorus]